MTSVNRFECKPFRWLFVLLIPVFCFISLRAADGELILTVIRADDLYGIPPTIKVHGARPGETLAVSAQAHDGRMALWRSQAVFRADEDGKLDLDSAVPQSGSYQNADGLGLLWSMQAPDLKRSRPFEFSGLDALLVRFTVAAASGKTAEAWMRRSYQRPGSRLVREAVVERGLRGFLYAPADGKAHPGLMLLNGSNGGLSEWLAQAFAANGFSCLTLAYFRYQDLPAEMDEIPLEYFQRGLDWMRSHPLIQPERIAVVGGSRGGELALLLGTLFPGIRAVVAWVPNSIVWQTENMDRQARGQVCSAWSLAGKPVPYAPFRVSEEDWKKMADGSLSSTRHMADMGTLDPRVLAEAVIAVERFRGPILVYSASDDQTGPGDESAQMILARLKGHPFEVRHIQEPETGHMSFLPNLITANQTFMNGGSARGDCHGGVICWRETLAFLHRHLDR